MIDYPAQGNPYDTLPPSERRAIGGVGTVYGCALTYPLRLDSCRTREIRTCVQGHTSKRFFYTIYVRSEVRTRVLDDVKESR